MLTIDDIRTRYPAPIVAPLPTAPLVPGAYCVGGACVLAAARPWRGRTCFPNEAELADALRQLQPALAFPQAIHAAYGIIAANDAGRFDTAWVLVAQALDDDTLTISKRNHSNVVLP